MRIQRHLAPTAAPVSVADLGRAILGLFQAQRYRVRLEAEIKRYFGVKHVFLLSSGKAALTMILRVLAATSARRKVIIPAYTCFSVPSAIMRAGCEVVLCDVDPRTMDFKFGQLEQLADRETLCIVCPHLLGQAADIQQAQAIAAPRGVAIVEDAAQAMGGKQNTRWLGTQGDIGFFSLGRGKNLTAGSGGVIITNSDHLADQLMTDYRDLPEQSLSGGIANVLGVVAMKLLIHPQRYWLPAGLPFLGLGETIFDREFPLHRLDGMRAGLLATWQQRLEQSNEQRRRNSRLYLDQFQRDSEALGPARDVHTAYLRFPVIMPTVEQKRELCAAANEQGLGVSPLYPTPISEIPELKASFAKERFPGAEVLAERLVTLPVHYYVDRSDIEDICSALYAVVSRTSISAVRDRRTRTG